MIIHENTIVSEDLFDEQFICNLDACKGECCVAGDSGAPLDTDELGILDDVFDEVKPYLSPESIQEINRQGRYLLDYDGEWVTPLNNGKECSYTVFNEKGIAKCGIELAYIDGKTDWPKPISCHLYPIRIVKLADHEALNYHRWPVCNAACTLGKKDGVSIFEFLKSPLVRKYGYAWYKGLERIFVEWKNKEE